MRVLNYAAPDSHEFDIWWNRSLDKLLVFTDAEQGPGDLRAMRSLTPDDQFWITGRGPVFVFEHNPAPELWDPGMVRGEWVVIDGGLFQVTGVEMRRPLIAPTEPYGDRTVGLLVRAQTDLPPNYLRFSR